MCIYDSVKKKVEINLKWKNKNMWYFADEIGPHIKSLTTTTSKGCKENLCLTVKILETLCDGGLICLCSLKTSALKYPYEKKEIGVLL